ncbi:polyprenyl synthetase family protein [Sporosarcina sp. JAI121]|uniref:polyprenyl synthetase family protein n=1 Tax=Sporosarcina sp. JAI121 TaxID=2723064 RepID=UPI0015C6D23F|nr:farnesyl diphosphate synthase [Sporosarcina sp. JAI121]NYF24625.1 geranylgeranyl diphosphate synthase type II [Sporosarcina sp. JAI121]
MNEKLQRFITEKIPVIDDRLNSMLAASNVSESLKSSMTYSINAGGKRIRPLLVLATLEDLGALTEDALTVACAVELVHTYSLIHDDLPCMDDDDFRRGKPTNHIVYGEAVAVLAGDALQALAFGSLTHLQETSALDALRIIRLLADASGATGMVGGQVLDIEGETKKLSLSELETVHINKTGALLSFCIEAGAILAGLDEEKSAELKRFAYNIGLAFQIQDDILDITSTTEELGKTVGSDATSDKSTYPSLLGLEGAVERLEEHHQFAKESIAFLEAEHPMLGLFADYIVNRKS